MAELPQMVIMISDTCHILSSEREEYDPSFKIQTETIQKYIVSYFNIQYQCTPRFNCFFNCIPQLPKLHFFTVI